MARLPNRGAPDHSPSRLPTFWHVGQWWNQPIVYQQAV
jgi:hypothetical protein